MDASRPWHWEGSVVVTLRQHLEAGGWIVTATADTESKERGIDLEAAKEGRWLAVEVKGYPTSVYQHGLKRGEPKPTPPAGQARQWFSHALLSVMLLRDKRDDAEIAICLPDFETYRRLVAKTRRSLERLGFGVYFVSEDGSARLEVPHRRAGP